jgi:rfaE bifunctional protein nucleotidyltransferase chain/domain
MTPTIVFTNGCFDVLHRGHIELFKYAKNLGSTLIVGIDTDEKVKQDKGPDRPFNSLKDRIFILESIKYIDEVMVFGSKQELQTLVASITPDILVKGTDWKGKEIVGEESAKEVRFFERIEGYSTTEILENSPNW